MTKLGIIGMGQMGEAVAQGLRASEHAKDYAIRGTTRTPESARDAESALEFSAAQGIASWPSIASFFYFA